MATLAQVQRKLPWWESIGSGFATLTIRIVYLLYLWSRMTVTWCCLVQNYLEIVMCLFLHFRDMSLWRKKKESFLLCVMYWHLCTQAPPRFYLAKLGEGLGEKRHDRKWWTRFVMMATCPHTMQPVLVIERTTNTKQKTFYVKGWEHARCFALKQGVTVILSPGLVPAKSLQLLTKMSRLIELADTDTLCVPSLRNWVHYFRSWHSFSGRGYTIGKKCEGAHFYCRVMCSCKITALIWTCNKNGCSTPK